jgi:hypothetical protein
MALFTSPRLHHCERHDLGCAPLPLLHTHAKWAVCTRPGGRRNRSDVYARPRLSSLQEARSGRVIQETGLRIICKGIQVAL